MTLHMTMLPHNLYLQAIRDVPLICIDLLILNPARDAILLGRRKNRPAQGDWFVPGGRIRKGECQSIAFERIAQDELGMFLDFRNGKLLGVYNHIYSDNFYGATLNDGGHIGTHCIPVAYIVQLESDEQCNAALEGMLVQHEEARWMPLSSVTENSDVNPYTKEYLIDNFFMMLVHRTD